MTPPTLILFRARRGPVDTPVRPVDPVEPGSVEAIAAATSDPRFLSPWVASLPDSPTVPSPLDYLHRMRARRGARGHRADVRVPARSRGCVAARASLHDRSQRSRPRHPDARRGRRSRHPRARPPEGGDLRARGPRTIDRRRAAHRWRAADLLLQRGAALRRDRLDRGDARARLPARGLRAADDPADPARAGGARQPRFESRRPRSRRRVVLPLPQRPDRLGHAAAAVAALLVELRVRRHQPRHPPADPRGDEGRPQNVPRVAPDGRARPARGVRADAHLERHGPLQPEHRPDHVRRVPRDELPRGARADGARDARGVDVEVRRGLRPSLSRLGRDEPQQRGSRLRDLGQHDARAGAPRAQAVAGDHRVVPAAAAAARVLLVGPRQPELHRDGRAVGARLHGRQREGDVAQLLPEGLELAAQGRHGGALRLHHPGGPGRPCASGAAGGAPARPADRGLPRGGPDHARGAALRGRLVRGAARPAVPHYAVDLLQPQRYPKDGGTPYDDISWSLPAHYRLEAVPIADPEVSRLPQGALAALREPVHPAGPRRRRRPRLPAAGHRPGGAARRATSCPPSRCRSLRARSRPGKRSGPRAAGSFRRTTG